MRHREPKAWEDPIVAEVRRARERIFAECGYDLDKLAERLRESEAARSGKRGRAKRHFRSGPAATKVTR